MTSRAVLKRCKAALRSHYGSRLRGLVLYGSTARGEAVPGSDIDLLVVLAQPFDYFCERREIVGLLYPVQLESEQLISAKPAPQDDYERGVIQLYRNAKREGVMV